MAGPKNLLTNRKSASIPPQGLVVLPLLVVVKTEQLEGPGHTQVLRAVLILGDLQRLVEIVPGTVEITLIRLEQSVRSEDPEKIGVFGPKCPLSDLEGAPVVFFGSVVIPLLAIDFTQLSEGKHEIVVIGTESLLLDKDSALEKGSRLIKANGLKMAAAERRNEPTDQRMVRPVAFLIQLQRMFEQFFRGGIIPQIHQHCGVGPGRVDSDRIVFQTT